MDSINVEILSQEIIKPSEPTPDHLKNQKLSFLDQISPPTYIPIVLLYQNQNIDHGEQSLLLKKSLARALTFFFPLAGKHREDFSVDINDAGAEYFEARVSCKQSEILEKPDADFLDQLLPYDPKESLAESKRLVVLGIKFSVFTCGGVAIGACVSHKVADGASTISFFNAWAAISRGVSDEAIIAPSFEAATYFPRKNLGVSLPAAAFMKQKVVSKRFVFNKSTIATLREEASSSEVKDPTRVEAVSTFLWKRLMAVTRAKHPQVKLFELHVAVNLRERMVPPLPPNAFGNLWRPASAISLLASENIEQDHHALVSKMRNAIKQINSGYVKWLQDAGDEIFNLKKERVEMFSKGEAVFHSFTSWCRFPVYEIDFRWGKPSWVCSPRRPLKNLIILMSNKAGDGIEAWVTLLEGDMAILERDEELLSYVSS